MPTEWDIYSELAFEVQRFLWKQGVDVRYDGLAQWPLLVAGQSLPAALWLLRTVCAWIRVHDR